MERINLVRFDLLMYYTYVLKGSDPCSGVG